MDKFVGRHFFKILGALALAFALAVFIPRGHAANLGSFWINNSIPSGQSTLTAPAPLYTDAVVLLANAAQTQAVPAGAQYVVFSGACNFFVSRSGAATVPGATTTNGSASQQNPAAWWLANGETSLSLIAASNCIVTVSFYTQ